MRLGRNVLRGESVEMQSRDPGAGKLDAGTVATAGTSAVGRLQPRELERCRGCARRARDVELARGSLWTLRCGEGTGEGKRGP